MHIDWKILGCLEYTFHGYVESLSANMLESGGQGSPLVVSLKIMSWSKHSLHWFSLFFSLSTHTLMGVKIVVSMVYELPKAFGPFQREPNNHIYIYIYIDTHTHTYNKLISIIIIYRNIDLNHIEMINWKDINGILVDRQFSRAPPLDRRD